MCGGGCLQECLCLRWRKAYDHRLRLAFEPRISGDMRGCQEAIIEPAFGLGMQFLRLGILEEPFSPAFERSSFGRQHRAFSRTMTLIGSCQILEENSPGYAINRQMMCTEQEPSCCLGALEQYGAKHRARCKIQA